MSKRYFNSSEMVYNMTAVTVHIAACVVVFNSSMSAIGSSKTMCLMQLQKKNSKGIIPGEHRVQGINPSLQ